MHDGRGGQAGVGDRALRAVGSGIGVRGVGECGWGLGELPTGMGNERRPTFEISASFSLEFFTPSPYRVVDKTHAHATLYLQLQRAFQNIVFATWVLQSGSTPSPQLSQNFRQSAGKIIASNADGSDGPDGTIENLSPVFKINLTREEAVQKFQQCKSSSDDHLKNIVRRVNQNTASGYLEIKCTFEKSDCCDPKSEEVRLVFF